MDEGLGISKDSDILYTSIQAAVQSQIDVPEAIAICEPKMRVFNETDYQVFEKQLLPNIGIRGRKPTPTEATYLRAWYAMGFDVRAVELAYEHMLFNIKVVRWTYWNGILKNWHSKNLHTCAEIIAYEKKNCR
jgi:hypothetical protein